MASLIKAHVVYLMLQSGEVSLFAGASRLGSQGSPVQTAFAAEIQPVTWRRSDGDITVKPSYWKHYEHVPPQREVCFSTRVGHSDLSMPPGGPAKHLDWEGMKPTYQWPKIGKAASSVLV